MRAVLAAAALVIILSSLTTYVAQKEIFANDISWPQCGETIPSTTASGIVGVNGGRIFSKNPCFGREASRFKHLAVYLNTGYPGLAYARHYESYPLSCQPSDEPCLAYNYGFNAARYAIAYTNLYTVLPSRWWLDVETVNSWSETANLNRRAISGMIDALSRYSGHNAVGIYSAPRQWRIITGDWHNGLPAWVATGSDSRKDATEACKQGSFNEGRLLMAQYTRRLDENIYCATGSFIP